MNIVGPRACAAHPRNAANILCAMRGAYDTAMYAYDLQIGLRVLSANIKISTQATLVITRPVAH